MQQAGREHRSGVARGDDSIGVAVGDTAHGRDEARVGLGPHRLGGLVRHLDHTRRLDEREPLRVEARGTVEDDLDPAGRRVERSEDHLARRVVSTECVDGDARQLEASKER